MPVCKLILFSAAFYILINWLTALGHDKAQSIIDQITSAYDSNGGPPPGAFNFAPPPGAFGAPPFGGFPGAGESYLPMVMFLAYYLFQPRQAHLPSRPVGSMVLLLA